MRKFHCTYRNLWAFYLLLFSSGTHIKIQHTLMTKCSYHYAWHDCSIINKVIYFNAKSRNLYLQKSSFSPVHRQQLVMQIRARLCQVEAEWTYMRHVHQHHTYTMELGDWHVDHNIRLWLWLLFWFRRALASMTAIFCNLFFYEWL